MSAIASIRASLRQAPNSVLAFAILHIAAGCVAIGLLISKRCVEDPCPPDHYCLDGCSLYYDPWVTGDAPYFLACSVVLIAAAIAAIGGKRTAGFVVVASVFAYFALNFYVSLRGVNEFLVSTGEPHGLIDILRERWAYSGTIEWLLPLSWVLAGTWFVIRHRSQKLHGGA
jgi:hypothetical protein